MTATDASRGFSALLDRVEHGQETVVITRDGREIAEIHPKSSQPRTHSWADIGLRFQGLIPVDPQFGTDVLRATDNLLDWENPWVAD